MAAREGKWWDIFIWQGTEADIIMEFTAGFGHTGFYIGWADMDGGDVVLLSYVLRNLLSK